MLTKQQNKLISKIIIILIFIIININISHSETIGTLGTTHTLHDSARVVGQTFFYRGGHINKFTFKIQPLLENYELHAVLLKTENDNSGKPAQASSENILWQASQITTSTNRIEVTFGPDLDLVLEPNKYYFIGMDFGHLTSAEYLDHPAIGINMNDPYSEGIYWHHAGFTNDWKIYNSEVDSATEIFITPFPSSLQTIYMEFSGEGEGCMRATKDSVDPTFYCTEQSPPENSKFYYNYPISDEITLEAQPKSGFIFSGWHGDDDCLDGIISNNNYTINCIATFEPEPYIPNPPQAPTSVEVNYKNEDDVVEITFDGFNDTNNYKVTYWDSQQGESEEELLIMDYKLLRWNRDNPHTYTVSSNYFKCDTSYTIRVMAQNEDGEADTNISTDQIMPCGNSTLEILTDGIIALADHTVKKLIDFTNPEYNLATHITFLDNNEQNDPFPYRYEEVPLSLSSIEALGLTEPDMRYGLPQGMTININGKLSGAPNDIGNYFFKVRIFNLENEYADAYYSLKITSNEILTINLLHHSATEVGKEFEALIQINNPQNDPYNDLIFPDSNTGIKQNGETVHQYWFVDDYDCTDGVGKYGYCSDQCISDNCYIFTFIPSNTDKYTIHLSYTPDLYKRSQVTIDNIYALNMPFDQQIEDYFSNLNTKMGGYFSKAVTLEQKIKSSVKDETAKAFKDTMQNVVSHSLGKVLNANDSAIFANTMANPHLKTLYNGAVGTSSNLLSSLLFSPISNPFTLPLASNAWAYKGLMRKNGTEDDQISQWLTDFNSGALAEQAFDELVALWVSNAFIEDPNGDLDSFRNETNRNFIIDKNDIANFKRGLDNQGITETRDLQRYLDLLKSRNDANLALYRSDFFTYDIEQSLNKKKSDIWTVVDSIQTLAPGILALASFSPCDGLCAELAKDSLIMNGIVDTAQLYTTLNDYLKLLTYTSQYRGATLWNNWESSHDNLVNGLHLLSPVSPDGSKKEQIVGEIPDIEIVDHVDYTWATSLQKMSVANIKEAIYNIPYKNIRYSVNTQYTRYKIRNNSPFPVELRFIASYFPEHAKIKRYNSLFYTEPPRETNQKPMHWYKINANSERYFYIPYKHKQYCPGSGVKDGSSVSLDILASPLNQADFGLYYVDTKATTHLFQWTNFNGKNNKKSFVGSKTSTDDPTTTMLSSQVNADYFHIGYNASDDESTFSVFLSNNFPHAITGLLSQPLPDRIIAQDIVWSQEGVEYDNENSRVTFNFYADSNDTISFIFKIKGNFEQLDKPYFAYRSPISKSATLVSPGAEIQSNSGTSLTMEVVGDGKIVLESKNYQCTDKCTETFQSDTSLELSAVSGMHSNFLGWTGDCSKCKTESTCSIAAYSTMACTAQFSYTDKDNDKIPDFWEINHTGSTTQLSHFADFDQDGFSDYTEYINFISGTLDSDGNSFDPTIINSTSYDPTVLNAKKSILTFLPAILSGNDQR